MKLNTTTQAAIVAAILAGMPKVHAARTAGISARTFHRWCARGKKDKRGPYWRLCHALKKAESQALGRNVAIINRAAAGGTVISRVTKPDGSVVEKLSEPTWFAAAWFLERCHPEHFALNRNEVRDLIKSMAEMAKTIKVLEEEIVGRKVLPAEPAAVLSPIAA